VNLAKLAVMTGGLPFDSPADVAVALNGDIYVADSQNERICRIDKLTNKITTVAGSGDAAFDGDLKQATQAALNSPNAIAVSRNGDLYIADTLNNRVRLVSQTTGLIRTIAGDGQPGDSLHVGDGGLATRAHLDNPTDVVVAPNGDVFIADMGHNRVRRVDVVTGMITTVAGDGTPGSRGDGGPAARASLSGPAGIALVGIGRQLTLYIADYYNGSIRVVNPLGVITTLATPKQIPSPTRLAYRTGGWLYVASDTGAVTAVNVNKGRPYQLATTTVHRVRKVT
jgi:sugar lactone lactonase YvrE